MFKHKHMFMAIKTITITEDAYESIKRLKSAGESFSQLFLRISKQKMKVKDLLGAVKMTDEEYKELKRKTKKYREEASKDMEARLKRCTF